ncbi:MAG: hypothetical protein A3H69_03875 [Candidatus Sungbacteria bacterium RIFCSPLOWO2_02_FULL_47_9]|nr:MAG: hypothetical protein A3H69_03875 [Candidatus Sungbacteria bacterium RIFCSPLOWO2_02_FULL_47_9]
MMPSYGECPGVFATGIAVAALEGEGEGGGWAKLPRVPKKPPEDFCSATGCGFRISVFEPGPVAYGPGPEGPPKKERSDGPPENIIATITTPIIRTKNAALSMY